MRTLRTLTVLVCALAALSASAKTRSAVHVHENASDGTVIPKEIYGQFSEHLGSCIYGGLWVGKDSPIPNVEGYRLDVLNALKELQVPVMRWPGGCFADDYHWMDGIGPQEQRAVIANNNWGGTLEDNSFGTHEFLNLCEMLGCQPYISGNVGSGSPEELAKWVEYMTSDTQSTMAQLRRANGRAEPWDVKYLGIGNEAWGCGGNMLPEYYSSVFRRYATYTRDYNKSHPLYKIASGASEDDYNWTETCVDKIGPLMNAIAVHYYTCRSWTGSKGSATDFTPHEYYATLGRSVAIEPIIKKHMKIMDRYDPDHKIDLLVDEWGTWFDVQKGTNPGHLHQQSTMRDAIVAALSLNIFHKYTDRIKMANIAQVVNVLQSMILTDGPKMALTPTYHVFNMYKVHQDALYVPVSFPSKAIAQSKSGPVPSLSVTASRKDGVLTICLVNPSLDAAQNILLDWDNFAGSREGDVSATILNAAAITDCNVPGEAAKVAPKPFGGISRSASGLEFTIPAASVLKISVKQ